MRNFAELVRDTSNDPHLVREAERLLTEAAAPQPAEGVALLAEGYTRLLAARHESAHVGDIYNGGNDYRQCPLCQGGFELIDAALANQAAPLPGGTGQQPAAETAGLDATPLDHTAECKAAMYRGPHVCICGASAANRTNQPAAETAGLDVEPFMQRLRRHFGEMLSPDEYDAIARLAMSDPEAGGAG